MEDSTLMPEIGDNLTIEDIERISLSAGDRWFSPDFVKMFRMIAYDYPVIPTPNGWLFITSEIAADKKRKYSSLIMLKCGSICAPNITPFEFKSKKSAIRAIEGYLSGRAK